jgi:hypothetical protein
MYESTLVIILAKISFDVFYNEIYEFYQMIP